MEYSRKNKSLSKGHDQIACLPCLRNSKDSGTAGRERVWGRAEGEVRESGVEGEQTTQGTESNREPSLDRVTFSGCWVESGP